MKDFIEMTADEIRSYRGPVHWARVSVVSEVGTVLRIDCEHPTAELLAEHLAALRVVEVHDRGVIEHARGNPDYDGHEGIDFPSQGLGHWSQW